MDRRNSETSEPQELSERSSLLSDGPGKEKRTPKTWKFFAAWGLMVPFWRTQEASLRMIIVAILGSVYLFLVHQPILWLGFLFSVINCRKTFGATLTTAYGVFFGGALGSLMGTLWGNSIRTAWGVTYAFAIAVAGLTMWPQFNIPGKKQFHIFFIASMDITMPTPDPLITSISNETSSELVSFAHANALLFILLCIAAILPYPRLAKSELKNEFALQSRLLAQILRIQMLRIKHIDSQSYYPWKSQEGDLWKFFEFQQLKSYKRFFTGIDAESVFFSSEPYQKKFQSLTSIAKTLHLLSDWISDIPPDLKEFPPDLVESTHRLASPLLDLLEANPPQDIDVAQAAYKNFKAELPIIRVRLIQPQHGFLSHCLLPMLVSYALGEVASSIIQNHFIKLESRFACINFLWEWAQVVWGGIIPWSKEHSSIYSYLRSKAGQRRLMSVFGFTVIQSVALLFWIHPTLKRLYSHTMWIPITSALTFNPNSIQTFVKGRARVLGTTVGGVCGYFYLSFATSAVAESNAILSYTVLVSSLCLLIFCVGLASLTNEDFAKIAVLTFIVTAYGYNELTTGKSETIEQFAMHRFTTVLIGVFLVIAWFALFWLHSARGAWKMAFNDVVESFRKITQQFSSNNPDTRVDIDDQNPIDTFGRDHLIYKLQILSDQLQDDVTLVSAQYLDQKHVQGLMLAVRSLSRNIFWFATYTQQAQNCGDERTDMQQDLLNSIQIQAYNLNKSWDLLISLLSDANFLQLIRDPHSRNKLINFAEYKITNDELSKKFYSQISAELKWNSTMWCALLLCQRLYRQVARLWDVIFQIGYDIQLQSMNNSCNL